MLARLPIRTKLLMAVLILVCIGGMLAFSGLQGVYAYRSVASSLSMRAAELPLSTKMVTEAAYLQRIYLIEKDERRPAMLFSHANRPTESSLYGVSSVIESMRSAVDQYTQLLDEEADGGGVLSDRSRERQMVARIRARLDRIEQLNRSDAWRFDSINYSELSHELERLNDDAQALPGFFHDRLASFRDAVRGQYRTWIFLAWTSVTLAVILLAAVLILFRQLVVRPFRQLVAGCRAVERGDYDTRIDLGTGDEFAELADAMNKMTHRFQETYTELQRLCVDLDRQVQERTTEVIRSEQLASVGFLAAGVAHEINNPMAAIAWSAEALENRLHDTLQETTPNHHLLPDQVDALRSNLRRIQDEAFRCKSITDRLLDFSRQDQTETCRVELGPLVEDVVALVSQLGQYRRHTISFRSSEAVAARVNEQEIRQVVLNLLTNALESLDDGGEVQIELTRQGNEALLAVADNGCGMTEEVQRNLFEPFFTRRRDGRGTGLGLSITYRIVQKHGGRITAYSEGAGQGSRLEVCLPMEMSNYQVDGADSQHAQTQAA